MEDAREIGQDGPGPAPEVMRRLLDPHVHTDFCHHARGPTLQGAGARGRALGLAGIGFAEHADDLYFARENWNPAEHPDRAAIRRSVRGGHARMDAYRAAVGRLRSGFVRAGLEVDPAADGGLALLDEDRGGWDYLLGAVHTLHGLDVAASPPAQVERAVLSETGKLVRGGVDVLAHPLRILRRFDPARAAALFRPLAQLLASGRVAAEIDTRGGTQRPEFYAVCLEEGVRLAAGSDAHSLEAVGAFGPQIDLLREIGALERLHEVLWMPDGWPPLG